MKHLAAAFFCMMTVTSAPVAFAESNTVPSELTLTQSIDLALRQNPGVLKAQQELKRSHGVYIEARSGFMPQANVSGQYTRIAPEGVDKFPFAGTNAPALVFKNQEQPWNVTLEVSQVIYSGGRIAANIRSAKLGDQIALLDFHRVVADTVLSVRNTFYRILLAQQQVGVREESVKLLARQLEDVRHRFDAGDVPKFNVLRAEVELANARPPLIRTQNELRLAKENLVKLLAIDTPGQTNDFTTVKFVGQLTAESPRYELSKALGEALARRPELQQAEKRTAVAEQDIKAARAGNLPELSIFGGYQVFDSTFRNDPSETVDGWMAGARVSWNIFDGGLTRGRLSQARARREETKFDFADTRRSIELEVRRAYSDYLQSVELLEAQKKTVEQAEESLRLAESRFTAGAGTQLDVLSAQTALTEARSNQAQALYDFNVAVAGLERATGSTVRINP